MRNLFGSGQFLLYSEMATVKQLHVVEKRCVI